MHAKSIKLFYKKNQLYVQNKTNPPTYAREDGLCFEILQVVIPIVHFCYNLVVYSVLRIIKIVSLVDHNELVYFKRILQLKITTNYEKPAVEDICFDFVLSA